MPSKSYTVILRWLGAETRFDLTEEQIRFDAPNYFTNVFFGDFAEGIQSKNEITLSRNPAIFRFLYEHLAGYELFPLVEGAIPGMSILASVKNIKHDALFYGLDTLATLAEEQLQSLQPQLPIHHVLYVRSIRGIVCGYRIKEEHLDLYLEHFKRGDLGSQQRGWLPLTTEDEVIAVWDKHETTTTSYAIVRTRFAENT